MLSAARRTQNHKPSIAHLLPNDIWKIILELLPLSCKIKCKRLNSWWRKQLTPVYVDSLSIFWDGVAFELQDNADCILYHPKNDFTPLETLRVKCMTIAATHFSALKHIHQLPIDFSSVHSLTHQQNISTSILCHFPNLKHFCLHECISPSPSQILYYLNAPLETLELDTEESLDFWNGGRLYAQKNRTNAETKLRQKWPKLAIVWKPDLE